MHASLLASTFSLKKVKINEKSDCNTFGSCDNCGVINVAVAAATPSIAHVKAQQQTSLTVTYYPKQVTRGEYFNVT
jgi:hypothetical protein